MPVLDAKALKTDPKGAAFLLSVLRRSPSSASKERPRPSLPQIQPDKRRNELFQGSAPGA